MIEVKPDIECRTRSIILLGKAKPGDIGQLLNVVESEDDQRPLKKLEGVWGLIVRGCEDCNEFVPFANNGRPTGSFQIDWPDGISGKLRKLLPGESLVLTNKE